MWQHSLVHISFCLRCAVPVVSSNQFDKDSDAVDESRRRVRSISVEHEAHELADNDLAFELFNQHIRPDGRLLGMRRLRNSDDVQQHLRCD